MCLSTTWAKKFFFATMRWASWVYLFVFLVVSLKFWFLMEGIHELLLDLPSLPLIELIACKFLLDLSLGKQCGELSFLSSSKLLYTDGVSAYIPKLVLAVFLDLRVSIGPSLDEPVVNLIVGRILLVASLCSLGLNWHWLKSSWSFKFLMFINSYFCYDFKYDSLNWWL